MGYNNFIKTHNNEFVEENLSYDREKNQLTSEENKDLFATGSLIYDEYDSKANKDNHHLLMMLNAFNLNH